MTKRLTLVLLILGLVSISASAQFNFGGETVKLGQSVWFGTFYNSLTNSRFDEPQFRQRWEDVEREFNVSLEWEFVTSGWPSSEAIGYLFPKVTAGEGNVIAVTTDTIIPILVAHGLLMPLTEWINDEYFERLPAPLKPTERFSRFLGENWAFQFGPIMGTEAAGVFWNKELFAKYGLPDLYELYEAGEWTWEAMEEIALKLTQDTTGDGRIDQIGVALRDGRLDWRAYTYWVYTNNGSTIREVNGEIIFALDEEASIESFEFWRRLLARHAVGGSWEFDLGNVGMLIDFADRIRYMRGVDFEFGFLPLPKGPRAKNHVAVEYGRWVAVLPVTAENPEGLIELWHALYGLATPYITDLEAWEEQYYTQYSYLARDQESIKHFRWATENSQPVELLDVFASVPDFPMTVIDILEGRIDAAQGMAKVKPSVQALIDELFDQ